MPLVVAGGDEEEAFDAGHEQARKIRPAYARGDLVRVAVGRNLPEAELIKGVLLEQGIPSMLRRTRGFDVPDFLAAGPRDVLVPTGGAAAARELLGEADRVDDAGAAADGDAGAPARGWELRLTAALLAGLLAFGAIAGVLWLLLD
jgi:hypothetical protein